MPEDGEFNPDRGPGCLWVKALTCAPQQIEWLELRDLERAIMSLSEEQRTAVVLLGLTPANYREIASAYDVPVGTIRSRLSRGRKTLRKLMGIAPSQHSRASRPLRAAAAATVRRRYFDRQPPFADSADALR